MATSERANQILCRYFVNGACRDGENCRFSHNRSDRLSNVCRYYQRGQCSYGSGCRYDHIREDRPSSSRQSNNNHCVNRDASLKISPPISNYAPDKKINLAKTSKLRADAAEFIPFRKDSEKKKDGIQLYSQAVTNAETDNDIEADTKVESTSTKDILCPYNLMGHCWYGEACSFAHGQLCDLCNQPVLHPTDNEHNAKHRKECLAEHEREMESAFALAKSREKQCGICMDIVLDKNDSTKQRFGVLPNCKHCFCLDCIRQWRKAKTFENKIIRACPECRTLSDFVIPSTVWVDEDDEKRALIDAYQSAMKQKTCKYFLKSSSNRADGDEEECPFGNKCFYKHVRSDGEVVPGDSPRTIRHRMKIRQRRRLLANGVFGRGRARNNSGSITDIVALWNFVSARNFGNSSDDNGVGGAGSSSGRGEAATAGAESRNRPNRHSSSLGNDSSADWLWDELEYELNILNVSSGNEDDDDGADDFEDFEAEYLDDSDWETSAVWE